MGRIAAHDLGRIDRDRAVAGGVVDVRRDFGRRIRPVPANILQEHVEVTLGISAPEHSLLPVARGHLTAHVPSFLVSASHDRTRLVFRGLHRGVRARSSESFTLRRISSASTRAAASTELPFLLELLEATIDFVLGIPVDDGLLVAAA